MRPAGVPCGAFPLPAPSRNRGSAPAPDGGSAPNPIPRCAETTGGYTPAAAMVKGGLAPDRLPPRRWALLIGHEARGLDPQWADGADFRVTIPMASGSESLNAGVAGSLLMYAMAPGSPGPHH